jgi:hypothetical protein
MKIDWEMIIGLFLFIAGIISALYFNYYRVNIFIVVVSLVVIITGIYFMIKSRLRV